MSDPTPRQVALDGSGFPTWFIEQWNAADRSGRAHV